MPTIEAAAREQRLDWPDGDFRYLHGFWPPARADRLFAQLDAEIDWQNHPVRLFGREYPAPRQSCWFGDAGIAYRYSGVRHQPRPWPPAVAAIGEEVARRLGVRVNGALANRYRDGRDRMGWHSDDEPELGPAPTIVSASFGAERRFLLRHRTRGLRHGLALGHGSVLVMAGASQRCWQHALPPTRRPCAARINLTFRFIRTPDP